MQILSNKVVQYPRNILIHVLQCPDLAAANHSLHDIANHGHFGTPAISQTRSTTSKSTPTTHRIATKHNSAYQIANWRPDNPRSTHLLPQILGSRTDTGVRLPSHLQALISPHQPRVNRHYLPQHNGSGGSLSTRPQIVSVRVLSAQGPVSGTAPTLSRYNGIYVHSTDPIDHRSSH
jgi:hypothetical protein